MGGQPDTIHLDDHLDDGVPTLDVIHRHEQFPGLQAQLNVTPVVSQYSIRQRSRRRAGRTGVERQDAPTPLDEVGTLSFWGAPAVDLDAYTLTVDGAVERPALLRFDEILALPSVEQPVRMDCVSGFRNNTVMRGVPFAALMERVGLRPGVRRAIFYCADGYYESSTLADLDKAEALLVYELNGERVAHLGYPLRVAIPGKYGYKWAKWVQRIEIVTHDRKGYWPRLGLPDRANVGDLW